MVQFQTGPGMRLVMKSMISVLTVKVRIVAPLKAVPQAPAMAVSQAATLAAALAVALAALAVRSYAMSFSRNVTTGSR